MQIQHSRRFSATLVAAVVLVASASYAQFGRQPAPTNPMTDHGPDEMQVWQGRVVRVVGDGLVVKVEGEQEKFEVVADAKVRKDRKNVDLRSLIRGDFVTVKTVGRGEGEVAVSVRAFSLR